MRQPAKPLPPGKTGVPVLGETLSFLKNAFGFIEDRTVRYGPVFRTRLFGRETAVIVGPDASGKFIDPRSVQRSEAMLPHIQEFFGGQSLPALDGEDHAERKRFVLAAFTREAISSYIPKLQRIVGAHFARWAQQGEIRWVDEFNRLAFEAICETILGLPPGPKVEKLRADYEVLSPAFSSLPIPLPGTAYSRARGAMRRILEAFAQSVREHQQHPADDGLSRIVAVRSPTSGRAMTVDEAKTELHHIIIAGLIVWAWFVTTVLELDRHPEVRARLLDEVKRISPSGPLTVETLHQMKYLDQVTMEVRRLSPVVPVFFGKARETFEFKDRTIPASWMVLWAHRSSHLRAEVYADPLRFDPDRFSDARAEHKKHEHAFVPNGAGMPTGHKCAGYEFAPCFLQVFTVELLRGYSWEIVPGQDLSYDWRMIPPPPRSGLKARVKRASV